jgi:hypothetical protein
LGVECKLTKALLEGRCGATAFQRRPSLTLSQASKRMQYYVDDLLSLKQAWLGWDALLGPDGADEDAWEYRLNNMPVLETSVAHDPDRTFARNKFKAVCAMGSTLIARMFAEYFSITTDDVAGGDFGPFRFACKHGHLEVARWITDEFDLGSAEARLRDNYVLGVACQNGFLDVAIWLVERFKLDVRDVRADNNFALVYAAKNGHAEVVEWMLGAFPALSIADLRTDDCAPFRLACQLGHLEVARLLYRHFPMELADVRSSGNYALHNAVQMGRWHIAHRPHRQ